MNFDNPTWNWLCRLYYDIGFQNTDFKLQIAWKHDDGEQMWSKRRSFLEVHTLEDLRFISRVNNRTLLNNEVVLDYDRVIFPENVMKDAQILAAKTWCDQHDYRYSIFHTGSKGVHFHIFIDSLARMNPESRRRVREKIIFDLCGDDKYFAPNFSGDYAKISDSVPIALEFVPHWKTGKPKSLIYSNFLT